MRLTDAPPTTATGRGARSGFTLAEMLIAFVLFSIIGGGILTLVMRQQRFYRSTATVIKVQDQLRQASSVLPLDLRTISTSDTLANTALAKYNADIYAKSDKMLDFRRVFGSSMICSKPSATPTTILLYPNATDSIAAITSFGSTPVVGDSLLIFDDGKMPGGADDKWVAYEVRALATTKGNKGCPWKDVAAGNTQPLLWPTDTVRSSYRLGIDRNISTTVLVGAPVRFFRRGRYELYQAGDQNWYLGYSDCLKTYTTASLCSDPMPVSGPYLPYSATAGQSGLAFAYYDSLGNALAASAESRKIARIDVVMRGGTTTAITRTGSGAGQVYRDSVALSIGIRNRR